MTGSKEDLPNAASDARVTICRGKQSTTLASGEMAEAGESCAVSGGTIRRGKGIFFDFQWAGGAVEPEWRRKVIAATARRKGSASQRA
jgi:hypothetical protein